MRLSRFKLVSMGAWLVACAGAPPPPPVAQEVEEPDAAVVEEPSHAEAAVVVDTPERTRPPSTESYEDAMSKPEALDVHDDHAHLSDGQLTGPMGGVTNGCRMPPSAKVTIKTAVQLGRAIGVTVEVRFVKPKSKSKAAKRPTKAAAKAEAKAVAKIAACIDRNVRAVVWPPSRRRDSFTMEL